MKDKDLTALEKYILDHREALDQVEEPDVDKMWERVRGQEPGVRGEERGAGSEWRMENGEWRMENGEGRNERQPKNHETIKQWNAQPPAPRTSSPNNWHISIGRNWRWGIAASIVLALGLYFLLPQKAETPSTVPLAEMFPEVAEQEAGYQRLIAQKEGALNLEEIDKEAFKEIFLELQLLEEVHMEYLQDLPHYEKNDRLVNTLMRYYERKIKILERLSREIEKKKINHEKINREKHI